MTQHQGEAKEGSVYPGLRVQSFQSTMVEQEKEEGKGEAEDMTIFGRFLIPPHPHCICCLVDSRHNPTLNLKKNYDHNIFG